MDVIDQDHNEDGIIYTKTNIDADGIMNLLNILIGVSLNKIRSELNSREE
tara:strand:- start:698 stop:847 length:150 start_codon:yes stop_codon:yes gene_type:complete